MIAYAAGMCRKKGASVLKLDCAGGREKLCGFYEDIGFRQAGRKMVGPFDVALYEMRIE
jgi:hypothetical protein